jgi:hypothetical protein
MVTHGLVLASRRSVVGGQRYDAVGRGMPCGQQGAEVAGMVRRRGSDLVVSVFV